MIRWTKDGKVGARWTTNASGGDIPVANSYRDLADALDEAVAALRQCVDLWRASGSLTADDVQTNVEETLRRLGVEP